MTAPKKPKPPPFQRPSSHQEGSPLQVKYSSLLSMLLQVKAWHKYDLEALLSEGLITEEDATRIGIPVLYPHPDVARRVKRRSGEKCGFTLMPAPMPEEVWEKVAFWQQRPWRESLNAVEIADAVTDQLSLFYGEDDPHVKWCRERADELRRNPVDEGKRSSPTDPVDVAGVKRDRILDQKQEPIALRSDEKRAEARGRARELTRGD